jgi:hypothetical protein
MNISYKLAVSTYRNTESKNKKREMELDWRYKKAILEVK